MCFVCGEKDSGSSLGASPLLQSRRGLKRETVARARHRKERRCFACRFHPAVPLNAANGRFPPRAGICGHQGWVVVFFFCSAHFKDARKSGEVCRWRLDGPSPSCHWVWLFATHHSVGKYKVRRICRAVTHIPRCKTSHPFGRTLKPCCSISALFASYIGSVL